jgi:hypothetical protein
MVVTRCNSRGHKSDQTSHDILGATCAVAKFDQACTRAKHALSDKDKSQMDKAVWQTNHQLRFKEQDYGYLYS